MDWLQIRKSGIYLPPAETWIDPDSARDSFIASHAHADHFPPGGRTVYATPPTLDLAKSRYKGRFAKDPRSHAFGEAFQVGPVKVSFLPAGHMLGSAQVLLEYKGQRALYTGDFNTGENLCTPLQAPEKSIDLLITESTFGGKKDHSSEVEALQALFAEAGQRPVMMGAYVMGKAQRLTQLLNEHFPERTVFIHKSMLPFHRAYERHSFPPGNWLPFRRQMARKQNDYIYLVPPGVLRSYEKDIRYFRVFASGWDRTDRWHWIDGQLDISDHASGKDILTYIGQVQPKKVGFVHGYPEQLIPACEAMGIEAESHVFS